MKERDGGADNHLRGYRALAAGLSLFAVGGLTGQSPEGCGSEEIQALTQSVAEAIDRTRETDVPTGYDASYSSEAIVSEDDINLIYTGLDYSDGSWRISQLHGDVVGDEIVWDTAPTEIPTGLTNPSDYIKIGSDEYVVAEDNPGSTVLYKNGQEFLDLGFIAGISRTGNDNELYVSESSGGVYILDLTKGIEEPDRTTKITLPSSSTYDYTRPVIWPQGKDLRLMTRHQNWDNERICSFDTQGGLTWKQDECPTALNGLQYGVVSTNGLWFFATDGTDKVIKVSPINPEPPIDADGDGSSPPDDCDDSDPDIHPGATEEVCDGKDNDCNGSTSDNPDQDGDGVKLCLGDCDDADPGRYSGKPEQCGDGIDQDCNGTDLQCPASPTPDPTPTDEPTPTTVPTPSASPTPTPTTVPTPSASPTPTPQGDLDGDGIPDDVDGSIDSGHVSVEGIDESDVTIDGAGNIIVTDDILEGTQKGVITQLDGDFIYPGGILSGVEGMVMQQNGDTMLFSSASSGMRVVVEWNSLTKKNIITNEGTEMVTYRQNDDCEALFIQPGQQMDLQGIFAVSNPDDCVDQPDPTSTPSPSPTGQPTDSPTPSPTPGVTPTPTDGGTATPSPSPSPSPSQHPTDTPDPSQITPDPSDPSASPSADPTTSPTPPDTQEPTTIPGPTSEPHPSPDPKDTQSESGGGAGCGCETVPGQTPLDVQGQTRGAFALALATMGTWFSQRRRKMVP